MRNVLTQLFAAFILLVSVANAQDTLKKTVVKKPAITKTTTTVVVPPGAKGVTGSTAIPINPKTGRPYTHWGYGAYAQKPFDAGKTGATGSTGKPNTATVPPVKPITTAATTPPVKTALPVATPPVSTDPAPSQTAGTDSTTAVTPADKSLNGQYQYVLTKVYGYQKPLLAALWKNVIDTMNVGRRSLVSAQAKIAEQDKAMAGMKADAAAKEESVQQADEISLIGISLTKTAYNIIMWSLVLICAAVAIIVIARSGSLKHEATYRTGLYTELEEEYKTYKAKANEKEKKLARELQTERNKVDELMGRG